MALVAILLPSSDGRVSLLRATVLLVVSVHVLEFHLLVHSRVITTWHHCCGRFGFWLDMSRAVAAAAIQVFIICRRLREAWARRRLPRPPPPPEMDIV